MKQGDYRKLFDLKGKVVVVTGGAGILGAHFCAALADFGADVAVVDLDAEKALERAQDIRADYGVRAVGLACDVSDQHSVQEMLAQVERELGGVDVLLNNAASKSSDLSAFFEPVEQFSMQTWREVMSVNIDGMFLVARTIGDTMARRGGGSIIQTASIYGLLAPDQRIYEGSRYLDHQINTPAVYTASKAAVIGLTQHLASYWGDKGVRVNTLSPGGVQSGQNDTFLQRYAQRIPLGRMAQAQEMTGALIYLASDASSYVTGQNLIVDGGLSAW